MRKDLVGWQWSLYPEGHRDRRNLVLHLLTWPLFVGGLGSLVLAPLVGVHALVGALGIPVALIAQGRGHRGEAARPVPFDGPLDFASRFLCEQLVTFPRFVLGGGWARAWRDARSSRTAA